MKGLTGCRGNRCQRSRGFVLFALFALFPETYEHEKGRPKSAFVGNQPLSNTHDNVF